MDQDLVSGARVPPQSSSKKKLEGAEDSPRERGDGYFSREKIDIYFGRLELATGIDRGKLISATHLGSIGACRDPYDYERVVPPRLTAAHGHGRLDAMLHTRRKSFSLRACLDVRPLSRQSHKDFSTATGFIVLHGGRHTHERLRRSCFSDANKTFFL